MYLLLYKGKPVYVVYAERCLTYPFSLATFQFSEKRM